MPGPDMSLGALHSNTALLPQITLAPDIPVLGKDTESAMSSGAFWGTVGAVEKVAALLKHQIASKAVFLTGGGAERFSAHLSGIDFTVPELTLEGIRLSLP